MNCYICWWKGKKCEVEAETSYEAQQKAQAIFKCKKRYEITVHLCEKNNIQVVHTATE